jgi:type I restriction enzyme, R subunit
VSALIKGSGGNAWLTSKQLQDSQEKILRQPNRALLKANSKKIWIRE